MLPIPAQRRPPCSRRRERYPSSTLLQPVVAMNALLGWEAVAARRFEDGTVEVTYMRDPGLAGAGGGV